LAQCPLHARVSGGVGDFVGDAAGHDQDRGGPVAFGVAQCLFEALDRLGAFRGVRVG
jgi:hypothetical protein